jgi:hypothetical protein
VYAVYDSSGTLHYLGISRKASYSAGSSSCGWVQGHQRSVPAVPQLAPQLSTERHALNRRRVSEQACKGLRNLQPPSPAVVAPPPDCVLQIAVSLATHAEALPENLVHSVKVRQRRLGWRSALPTSGPRERSAAQAACRTAEAPLAISGRPFIR